MLGCGCRATGGLAIAESTWVAIWKNGGVDSRPIRASLNVHAGNPLVRAREGDQ